MSNSSSDKLPDETQFRIDFIVGMPRSGTTWIARLLNSHSNAVAIGETLYWGRLYVPPRNGKSYSPGEIETVAKHLKQGGQLFLNKKPGCWKRITTPQEYRHLVDDVLNFTSHDRCPSEIFRRVLYAVTRAEGKSRAIEKTPHHIRHVDLIRQNFPESKFIVIMRNPYDFMLSYKHQGDRLNEEAYKKFKALWHPLVCSFIWRSYARSIIYCRQNESADRDFRFFKLETFQTNTSTIIENILDFLDLPFEDLLSAVPPVGSSFPSGEKPTLDDIDIWWMNSIASKEINLLDYDVRKTQFTLKGLLSSVRDLVMTLTHIILLASSQKLTPKSNLISYFRSLLQ